MYQEYLTPTVQAQRLHANICSDRQKLVLFWATRSEGGNCRAQAHLNSAYSTVWDCHMGALWLPITQSRAPVQARAPLHAFDLKKKWAAQQQQATILVCHSHSLLAEPCSLLLVAKPSLGCTCTQHVWSTTHVVQVCQISPVAAPWQPAR